MLSAHLGCKSRYSCLLHFRCCVTLPGVPLAQLAVLGSLTLTCLTLCRLPFHSHVYTPQGDRRAYEEEACLENGIDWDLYVADECVRKRQYNVHAKAWEEVPYTDTPYVRKLQREWGEASVDQGVAHAMYKFGEGAERVVFQCSEVVSLDGGATAYCVGPRLVAKQPRYEQHMRKEDFHRTFCRTQGGCAACVPHWSLPWSGCNCTGCMDAVRQVIAQSCQ